MEKIDTVYIIVNSKTKEMMYSRPGTTAAEAWKNAIDDEIMGTCNSKKYLEKQGWVAKPHDIYI